MIYIYIYNNQPVPIVLTSPSLNTTNMSKCNITTINEFVVIPLVASDLRINSIGLFLVVSIPDKTLRSKGSDYVSKV